MSRTEATSWFIIVLECLQEGSSIIQVKISPIIEKTEGNDGKSFYFKKECKVDILRDDISVMEFK